MSALQVVIPNKLKPFQGNIKYTFKFRYRKDPDQNTNYNLCIIQQNKEAFLTNLEYNKDNEYELYGPDVDIHNLLISPSHGKISLEDLKISKYYNNINIKNYYFPYYDVIDTENKNKSVGLLTYDSTKIPYSEIPGIKELNDLEYATTKNKVINSTIELTLFGSLLVSYITSLDRGYAFALGGCLGCIYVKLLELSVDNIGKQNLEAFFNQFSRLGLLFGLSSSIIIKYHTAIANDKYIFVIGLIGFLVYHLAFIITYLPHNSIEEQSNEDKVDNNENNNDNKN